MGKVDYYVQCLLFRRFVGVGHNKELSARLVLGASCLFFRSN